jgi:hypothetical protein
MTRVEGPIVVRFDEWVILLWSSRFYRIVFDVLDGPSNLLGTIQKHLPPVSTPDGMVERATMALAKPQAAFNLEVRDHLLCGVLVLPNESVDVVVHRHPSVAGVLFTFDHIENCLRDDTNVSAIQFDYGIT